MNVKKLMVVAPAGWINQQQEDVIEKGGWAVCGSLPPGTESPGLGE
jgi:hypothetical protein